MSCHFFFFFLGGGGGSFLHIYSDVFITSSSSFSSSLRYALVLPLGRCDEMEAQAHVDMAGQNLLGTFSGRLSLFRLSRALGGTGLPTSICFIAAVSATLLVLLGVALVLITAALHAGAREM